MRPTKSASQPVSWLAIGGLAMALANGAAVRADALPIPPAPTTTGAPGVTQVPSRGMTMASVLQRFGAPTREHAAVGDGHPLHPPITRWDYQGFSVFFERNLVIDAVVPSQLPRLYHTNRLQPAP